MNMNLLLSRSTALRLQTLKDSSKRFYASKGILSDLNVEDVPVYDAPVKYDEIELERMRDKSRLYKPEHNILNNKKPHNQSYAWYHDTVEYRRRIMGKYGLEAAEVSPAIAWPTKEEIEDKREFERLAYPLSLQETWKKIEERKQEAAMEIKKREEEIDKVVVNFDKWREDLDNKLKKKEEALLAARAKKERMLQEVRDEYGYSSNAQDKKFQDLLLEKEKQDKKLKKAEKKKKHAERQAAKLASLEEQMLAKQNQGEEKESNDQKEK